jgi:hypothetical protein
MRIVSSPNPEHLPAIYDVTDIENECWSELLKEALPVVKTDLQSEATPNVSIAKALELLDSEIPSTTQLMVFH